jgi:hypothetical protein
MPALVSFMVRLLADLAMKFNINLLSSLLGCAFDVVAGTSCATVVATTTVIVTTATMVAATYL